MSKIRWGILGCGHIATHAIAPAIRWSANGELAAVASRDEAIARAKAAKIGAPRSHGSYDALLADTEIDAVYIGLPNGLHEEWALRAARVGKHVLCEKSLTLSAESARRVSSAFRARGLRVVEAFMYRHHPQWEVVRGLLADRAVGEVRAVRVGFTGRFPNPIDHRFTAALGGGALFDLTCYAVNAARMVLAAEPLRATGFAVLHENGEVDVATSAVLEFPGSVHATVHGSLRSAADQWLSILGTRGRIDVERPFVPEWSPVRIRLEGESGSRVFDVGGANHFLHQMEHVAALVLDPSRPAFPAEDGAANVAACEAIARSAARGVAVEIDVPSVTATG